MDINSAWLRTMSASAQHVDGCSHSENDWSMQQAAYEYASNGYVLAGWLRIHGKGPKDQDDRGWGLRAFSPADVTERHNIGLNHGLSRTAVLDVDDVPRMREVLELLGLDLDDLVQSTMSWRGNPERVKLAFRAPKPMRQVKKLTIWLHADDADQHTVFELRGAAEGKQAQDVLPPSIHPDTGMPYCFETSFRPYAELPELPAALADVWANWDKFKLILRRLLGDAKMEAEQRQQTQRVPRQLEGVSVIEAFNARHTAAEILERNGHEKKGKRWLRPNSTTGVPGIVQFPDGAVYSHSGGILADEKPHDAFDLFRILECDGDITRATRQAAALLGIQHQNRSAEPVGTAANVPLSSAAQAEPEPEPLRRSIGPAEPYPIDALGPILSKAVSRIQDVVQAPAAICGQSILAAASLAAQAHADVLIDGRCEPISLFAMTVAESGERKSAVDRLALRAHKVYEREQIEQQAIDHQAYELALAVHEAAVKQASKGKKSAGAISEALEDLGPPPTAPLNQIFLVPTPTLEGIHKLYATGKPSLGLFHDDAGEFLGGHSMNADNRMKSAAGLSRLWDSGEFDRIRAGDGASKYFGRRLAMHLMIQPVVAEAVLSDDVLTGQGLLARTLLAWPASNIGNRSYVEQDLTHDLDLLEYWRAVSALLTHEPALRPGSRNELEPRTLTLTPEAKRVWIAVHDAIEADQGDAGAFSSVRAWASKAPAQTLRIAAVITLIGSPDAGVIEAEAIDRAAELTLYHLREAVRIVGTASVPADIRAADSLLEWCHRERITSLHSSAAIQLGPRRIRTSASFNTAIVHLEKAGWAMPIEGGCKVDGKHRRRAWTIRGASR
jgi:hypothetical protein